MSIWNELRRRSVFKVGAAYALCAWIIAQVAVLINEPLGLPDRFDTAVLIILAIGFPLAILFSWVFELTPSGLRRTDDAPAEEGIAAAAGNTFNYVLAGLMSGSSTATRTMVGRSMQCSQRSRRPDKPERR